MGALHAGHISLFKEARHHDNVVISIFVNPLQFGPDEDYLRYPRPHEEDLAKALAAGVDVVFLPSVEEMYKGSTTQIDVGAVARRWEGEHRPGHFNGVATVVCKLLNIVEPSVAYFGLKDFQQCAVISKMSNDLYMAHRLQFCETLRETDGLAMSSRNQYLLPKDRAIAPQLQAQLRQVREEILAGNPVEQTLTNARDRLHNNRFRPDYLAYVCATSLEPLMALRQDSVILAAARLEGVRLIDNLRVS